MVTSDSETISGDRIPAEEVTFHRLKSSRWPLYSRTKNRLSLSKGDTLLFYVGGQISKHRQCIIATGIVLNKYQWSNYMLPIDTDDSLSDSPAYILEIGGISFYKTPVLIKTLLDKLSFTPKNIAKWGAVLQGGCLEISAQDLNIIRHFT
jgi:hypothetical protein